MKKAFTLVELLIAMGMFSVLVGMGITVSYKASLRQRMEQAGKLVENAIETARTNALAGKKIITGAIGASCTSTNQLAGWGVLFSSDHYDIVQYCGTLSGCVPSGDVITTAKYSPTSSITAVAPSPNPMIFRSVGLGVYSPSGCTFSGTNPANIVLNGTGFGIQVDVNAQGQIVTQPVINATPLPTAVPTAAPPTPTAGISCSPYANAGACDSGCGYSCPGGVDGGICTTSGCQCQPC